VGVKVKVDKTYIGEVEAWEYCIENSVFELPKKKQEVLILDGSKILSKDGKGFYLIDK
jgi:hypothetical protein